MENSWGVKIHIEIYPVNLNDLFLSAFEPLSVAAAASDWLRQRCTVAFMDLPGGLSMRRGSSEKKERVHYTREEKHTGSAAQLNAFTWFWEWKTRNAHNTVAVRSYCKDCFYIGRSCTAVKSPQEFLEVLLCCRKAETKGWPVASGASQSLLLEVLTGYTPDSVT